MLTRRVALPLAALTAFATLPALAANPAGASSAVMQPAARGGDDNGDPEGPSRANKERPDNCPTQLWTIPLEVKGLACILLLPKPDRQDDGGGGEESSSGGLGDLLG